MLDFYHNYSTACEYVHRLANEQIDVDSQFAFDFMCSLFRSKDEPGGFYYILVSTLLPDQTMPYVELFSYLFNT
jgi:hypothetical protein